MKLFDCFATILWIWSLSLCQSIADTSRPVLTGLDVLIEDDFKPLVGKRVGLVTNHTGLSRDGRHTADIFAKSSRLKLVALFGPEHGIRGRSEGGESLKTEVDSLTQVPIFSLYGNTNKPTPEMLNGVDVLVFDIQDVGARFYTYISSLFLTMEAAAEQNIPFVVLDRPNPIGGVIVEGPVLDPAFKSFVGIHVIALRHGMTIGELAQLFNGQGWMKNGVRVELTIVRMKNWRREMLFDETGLTWIKPSPNIMSEQTALLYPGICLLEATNLSEGRGTEHPFEYIGAPWLNAVKVRKKLMAARIPYVKIDTVSFIPSDIAGVATNNKFKNRVCGGLKFIVTDGKKFKAVDLGIHLLTTIKNLHPDSLQIREKRMRELCGDGAAVTGLVEGQDAMKIIAQWQKKLKIFVKMRNKYLIY